MGYTYSMILVSTQYTNSRKSIIWYILGNCYGDTNVVLKWYHVVQHMSIALSSSCLGIRANNNIDHIVVVQEPIIIFWPTSIKPSGSWYVKWYIVGISVVSSNSVIIMIQMWCFQLVDIRPSYVWTADPYVINIIIICNTRYSLPANTLRYKKPYTFHRLVSDV
jgi:hypothetical protein